MDYVLHLLTTIGIYIILTVSMNLLIGYGGLFSVAHAGFFAVGAYATALLTTRLGYSFATGLVVGIVLAGAVGALVAIPSLRISGDYLVIVSFGFQILIFSVLLNWVHLTGGPTGIPGIPRPELFGISFDDGTRFVLLVYAIMGLCLLFTWRLIHSPFGRVLKGIREDEVATRALGKDVARVKILVFILAAQLAAVAGTLYAHYISFIDPYSFTIDESIFILTLVIVGGVGTLQGSVLGTVFLLLLPEALKFIDLPESVAAPARKMLYGVLLIVFMLWRPMGLWGERQHRPTPVRSKGSA